MKFGILIFPTDTTMQPIELARTCERLGFDSLWLPEHSHIPTSRITPWGGRAGAPPLPEHYWRTHDAFVALGAAAAVTERLELGTGITLLAQRDPLWTAKEVASLDLISGGRLQFGIGYGWNKEEMASHGVRYTERRALLREKVLMMKQLWTEEVASYQGEHLSLEPSWAWPKPVQQPHPPILMGGSAGPKTIADMVEFCDGWMPLMGRHSIETLPGLRRALEDAGRDPSAFLLYASAVRHDRDSIERVAEAGFGQALFVVPSEAPDRVEERLEHLALLASELRG
jgi:probable F420-dependent oxidoreductase